MSIADIMNLRSAIAELEDELKKIKQAIYSLAMSTLDDVKIIKQYQNLLWG